MLPFGEQDERQTIKADAASSEGKSPPERMAIFADLLAMIDCAWASLPLEERHRRLAISDQLHRRPEPWWSNLRPEAQPDFACKN